MEEKEYVTLRFIIKLNIPGSGSVENKYGKLDIPVIYRDEIESKNMKEILKVILIMKGFDIIDGPFEVGLFSPEWDRLIENMPENYHHRAVRKRLLQIKAEMDAYKELQCALSNLIGGIGALIEDSELPEMENYPLDQWGDKYIVFNKNAFKHWLDSVKTVVGQVRGLID